MFIYLEPMQFRMMCKLNVYILTYCF